MSARDQWNAQSVIRSDEVTGWFLASLTKEQLKAAPSYDREQLARAGYGWSEQATRYFAGLNEAPIA